MFQTFQFFPSTELSGLESSAPPLSPPSAPTFPDLSEQLQYMNPHHKVVQQIVCSQSSNIYIYLQVHQQLRQVEQEDVLSHSQSEAREESPEVEEVEIIPYTDSQLHALYHNVELEKNVEFVASQ